MGAATRRAAPLQQSCSCKAERTRAIRVNDSRRVQDRCLPTARNTLPMVPHGKRQKSGFHPQSDTALVGCRATALESSREHAPGVAVWLQVTDAAGERYKLPFPCKLTPIGWLNAVNDARLTLVVRPTGWRPYFELNKGRLSSARSRAPSP
jgi:hypothetical protein